MIARIAKIVGWTAGGIAGLVVLLYAIVAAINWRDQEPSAAAIRFETLHRERPVVADSDNAYVFMMGLGVAPSEDPYAMGLRRKLWLEKSKRDDQLNSKDDPFAEVYDYKSARPPELTKLLEQCGPGSQTCAAEFSKADAVLHEWLAADAWLLQRYQTLLMFPGWHELSPYNVEEPLPPYQIAIDGQRLLLAKAKLFAQKQDMVRVKELLEQDIRFWRRVLQSSDLLISKMIATVALHRHFELGNVVLRQLPAAEAMRALPDEWHSPISEAERSMLRCFVGEWMFSSAILQTLATTKSMTVPYDTADRRFGRTIVDTLLLPLFQYQDSVNKSAEYLLTLTQTLDVPLDQYQQGMQKASAMREELTASAFPPKSLYNLLGNVLWGTAVPTYLPYVKRVADIEGTRRAALATVRLRQQGLKPDQVGGALASIELRNPYDNQSFDWDDATGSIVFTGMEEGERRVHRLLY